MRQDNPFLEGFLPAYGQSGRQYAMNKRFEAQQERLRKEAEKKERKERAKQVKYRADERAKRLEEMTEEFNKKAKSTADLKHRFTIANKRLGKYVKSGKLSTEDLEFVMERIGAESNTSGAMDLIADVEKRITAVEKPTKPAKPTADEKFNAVVEKYFSGDKLSPSEMRSLNRAIPEGLGMPPETAPEGVTGISGLRKSMGQGKSARQAEEKIGEAKRVWKAKREAEERTRAAQDKPDEYVMHTTDFDSWMRQPAQIKKYGAAYAQYRKKQLEGQISKAAGRSPAREAGFDANVRSVVPPDIPGVPSGLRVPPATAIPHGTPGAAPAARQGIEATPGAQMSPSAQMSPEEGQLDQMLQQLMAKAAENQKFIDSLKAGHGPR